MRNRGIRRVAVGARCRDGRAEAAGVPGLRLGGRRPAGGRRSGRREEGRETGQPGEGAGRAAAAGRFDGHRAHPLGHPWRPHGRQRAPAPRQRGPGRRRPQRHHRELRGAPDRAGRARPCAELRDGHRGRRPSAGRGVLGDRRPRRGDAAGVPAPGGRVHAGRGARRRPGRGGRRTPQLPAGGRRRRGRGVPGLGRRRVHRAHPLGDRAGPGPGGGAAPGRRDRHRLRRPPRRGAHLPRGLGRLGRREGRLRLLHAQGDRRAAQGGRRHPPRPDRPVGFAHPGRAADLPDRAARDRQGRDRGVRDGLPRRADRQVRHRALDADPLRGGAGQRVPLPGPDPGQPLPGDRHLPVRRDHGHPDGPAARPRAGLQGAGHLQHQRLHHPARVGRGALHARGARGRRRLHQGVPHPAGRLLPGRPLPGPGARHQVGRRGPRRDQGPVPDLGRGRARPGDHGAGPGAGPHAGRQGHRALPGPARRLPGRPRRRAQAQGTRLHARRGLRGGRAEARPDRADRGGHAGGGGRAVAARPLPPARQDRLQHPGDPGARGAHHRDRRGGGRGGRPVRRPPDPHPGHAHPAAAGGGHRAAPGLRLRAGRRAGQRGGPAAEPGEVGDGGVAAPPVLSGRRSLRPRRSTGP
ncbi:Glutamine--fructose-6-phosphate aminotransferase (isomerizing) [Streptomyces misionensis JCM 4497]